MSTPDTLRWWGDQFRTRTSEFYTSHVLVADLNYAADEIEKLQVENAKLRELVHTIFYCMQQERDCDGCAMNGAEGAITEHVGCDGLREVLRELGVEVDG